MATADCYQTLEVTTLDIWRIYLNRHVHLDWLSEDELQRFNRYHFEADRRKFAVARSSLRQILAHYSQQPPEALVFNYGSHGKPSLHGDGTLQFNLSHSGEYALCAVARYPVGVDIEKLRPIDRLEGLVKRCLAPSEQKVLTEISCQEQDTMFFQFWTCKEAYLKATGQGISESLTAIEVQLSPSPQLNIPNQAWQLQTFVPCDGYTAAVVVAPAVTQLRYWDYESPN